MTAQPNYTVDQQLALEASFSDEEYRPFEDDLMMNTSMFNKYSSPHDLSDWRQQAAVLLGILDGRKLLDLGCGMGEEAIYFAKLGANVTAIDISEVGINITKKRAERNNIAIEAKLMACPTSFADELFDVIHGLGIVHHVGVDIVMNDVLRLLKPGGIAVFLEPIGDVPWLENVKQRLHRSLVKRLNLIHVNNLEENLRWMQLEPWRDRFHEFKLIPYHLFFRARKLFPAALTPYFRRLDYSLLTRLPALRRFAGATVIFARKSP